MKCNSLKKENRINGKKDIFLIYDLGSNNPRRQGDLLFIKVVGSRSVVLELRLRDNIKTKEGIELSRIIKQLRNYCNS